MFALLLAYNYQLFMFFCCVHEVLLQQNFLLLWLIRNPPPPSQERHCYDFFISFCLCYGFMRLTTLEDLSFSVGGNFCLHLSVMLGDLWYHLVPTEWPWANMIAITEVPSNILKLFCILLYYFQGRNNNTI